MNNKLLSSYSAAGVFPIKILFNEILFNNIKNGRILPYHVQLCPTNRCNKNCSFCSCADRDKSLTLGYDEIRKNIDKFYDLGCRSITITGGGEPLLHPDIERILSDIYAYGIQIGLVTNGIEIEKIKDYLHFIKWVRISLSNESDIFSLDEKIYNTVGSKSQYSQTEFSFSYVITDGSVKGIENISKAIMIANDLNFTHVRLVDDLVNISDCVGIENIKHRIKSHVDDSIVIYQGRKEYTRGAKRCWISLLKPVIAADGKLYPCCGAQYAKKDIKRDYVPDLCMGSSKEICTIWNNQMSFDGSKCDRCYYDNYNKLLDVLLSGKDLNHIKFV